MEPIQEFYQSADNCRKELMLTREKFGRKDTTSAEWEAIDRGLSLMYLYCPESMKTIVHATLSESTRRQIYADLRGI